MITRPFETTLRNVRYAVRSLSRTPAFTFTVVLTLALGIGANTVVFSAIDAILLKPLPFAEPDRLVSVMETRPETGETSIAPVRLEEWNQESSTFDTLTGFFTEDVSESTGESPTRVRWAGVAPRFLDVWRVAPALGRDFVPEDSAQIPRVVMISDRLWRSRFDADPNILERTISLGDPVAFPFAIVGVLPASFLFPDRNVDVWFPNFTGFPQAQSRSARFYTGVGRLRPGVTVDQARADLEVVQARFGEQYPDTDREIGVSVASLADTVVAGARGSLWLVFGAVSVLLLIACTNIAALLLASASRREQEVAVRFSLGATGRAVAAQMLTEAAVLACAGGVVGLLIAAGAESAFRLLAPSLPRLDEVAIDGRILAYTMIATVAVTLLCGIFPALRNAGITRSLSHSGRAQVAPRHSVQWVLVGVQVALSVMLLSGAGLLLRSFDALSRVDPGFDPAPVLAFRVSGSNFEYVNSDVPARVRRTIDELATVPGVEAVATALLLPGVVGRNETEFELTEGGREADEPLIVEFRAVSPSYFYTMQIPVLGGEFCREQAAGEPNEIMVNRSLANRYPGTSIAGRHRADDSPNRIAGIVGDAREIGTDRDPVPTVYFCTSAPTATPWFMVRTNGSPAAAAATIRAKLREIEPQRTVYDLAPLEQHIGDAYTENWLRTLLLALFAGAALALSCLGVYGTLSYVVSLRRREVGLRVALGALSGNIVAQFVVRALRVVAIGCVAGLVLSLAFTRALSGMLYGVSPSDPITLASVVSLVVAVALLAAFLPAIRASRVDPMQALREE